MSVVLVRDCTGSGLAAVLATGWKGRLAGYTTGSAGVPWTPQQFAAHPGTVLIDQTPASTPWDGTADVDDVENGAVQLGEIAGRAKERKAAFAAGIRPGQREPMIYASGSLITPVVNALIAGGVTSGVHLWVASWGVSQRAAADDVLRAAGPFPIGAFQFAGEGIDDLSVFSLTWLNTVSVKQPPQQGPPYRHLTIPGQSLADIAVARGGTSVAHLLGVTAQAYNADDIAVLAGHHLPGGVPYYTSNP